MKHQIMSFFLFYFEMISQFIMYFVVLICCRASSLIFCCGSEKQIVEPYKSRLCLFISTHNYCCDCCVFVCTYRSVRLFTGPQCKEQYPGKHKRRTRGTETGSTFVIHHGSVGGYVIELTRDFRKVMEPTTASCLKVSGLQLAHWGILPWLCM